MLVVAEIVLRVEMVAEIVAAAGVREAAVVDVVAGVVDVLVAGAEIVGAVGVLVAAVVEAATKLGR